MHPQYISQVGSNRRPYAVWLVLAAGALLVMALIVAAPVSAAEGHSYFAKLTYQTFGHVCHQIPDRSFFIAGHPLAVCARCTGIYAGFLAAAWTYPLIKSLRDIGTPERKWLFIAVTPLVIDFGLELFGIWHNTHTSRLITGAILGAASVFYIMPGLLELGLRDWRHQPAVQSLLN
jgi:uncharacterized membrane protein